VRNTMLVLRNNVWRGNLAYQGVNGARKLHGLMTTDGDLKPDQGAWRKADASGAEYEGFGTIPEGRQTSAELRTTEAAQTGAPDRRWDPPGYEIGLQLGFLDYSTRQLEGVAVSLTSPNSGLPPHAIGLSDNIDGGWRGGISVTMNTWRWISSEFGYHVQRGKYHLEQVDIPGTIDDDLGYETYSVGLATRQFEYNVLAHARPRESRWRPYVAVGPAFQLMHLTDAPVKRAPKPFKLGLQNIGMLKAAFDFGRTAPLDGGGIYQLGLQYGAGVKFRVRPRVTMRVDFRETLSKNPEFVRESYVEETAAEFDPSYHYEVTRNRASGKFRQQRLTMGVAFTF
jgi:opacity protein-like surface antigen